MSRLNSVLTQRVLEFIKQNDGMSASVSVIGRAMDENYSWKHSNKYSGIVTTLKNQGKVREEKGRYYVS